MPIEAPGAAAGQDGVSPAIATLRQRLSKFETEDGRLRGLKHFQPRPTDVIISTTPKAGTTWMQQIVHQLRTRCEGDISEHFDEISSVVPFLEIAHDEGIDVNMSEQDKHNLFPRAFKTHAWYPHCPGGGRYIVVMREPLDIAVSFFKFFEGWFFEPGSISLDEFVRSFWLRRGAPAADDWMTNASTWDHFLTWWEHRNDENVLFLFYEDMRSNLRSEVIRVARFMGVPTDDELIDKVCYRCSLMYMKENERLFDEHLSREARNEAMGLPKDAGSKNSKVRQGGGNASDALPAALRQEILDRWRVQVGSVTGCDTYEALRAAAREERERLEAEQRRFNISPEMFERLMRGEAVSPEDIMGHAASFAPAATASNGAATDASSSRAKKSKKAKVSKKAKRGCC